MLMSIFFRWQPWTCCSLLACRRRFTRHNFYKVNSDVPRTLTLCLHAWKLYLVWALLSLHFFSVCISMEFRSQNKRRVFRYIKLGIMKHCGHYTTIQNFVNEYLVLMNKVDPQIDLLYLFIFQRTFLALSTQFWTMYLEKL